MFTYFILLCLIHGVRNYSENEQISVKPKQSLNLVNINVKPTVGQTSLAIIFDCTASMTDNLEEMRQGAKSLIDAITKRPDNPIYNYIFVCFNDSDIESAIVTTEKQVLMDVLNDVTLTGGDDCPKMTMGGILEGMKYVMDKSYVYIFTDATSKDYHKEGEVLDAIQQKKSTVSFFVTGGCKSKETADPDVFKNLAAHSNGEHYDLNTKDIGKVMDDFKEAIDKRLTTLKYIYESEGKTNTVDLNVDSNLEQLFVSVAGTEPVIQIFDPQNQCINATNVVKLDNLYKVKVDQPNSGPWSLFVGANSSHTIKITGMSNISFTFGFSLHIPDKIESTVYNPIIGVENILIIAPSNLNVIMNLTSVNLTSSNQSLTLTLKEINEEVNESIFYATEPFMVPSLLFKIHIFGFDKHDNEMERLISTSIEAGEKSPPYIEIAIKTLTVKEGDDLSIQCHVRSVSPITVKWMKNNKELLADAFDQSAILKYVIEKAAESNAGEYVCCALNERGISEESVQVSIEASLLLVNIHIEIPCNQQILYENEYELLEDNLFIKKLTRNHKYATDKDITNIFIDIPTEYENTTKEIFVVKGKPLLNTERVTKGLRRTGSNDLEIKRFHQLNLICPFENHNTIRWYKKGCLIQTIETNDSMDYEQSALRFNHTSYNDRGEYMCTAENEFGQDNYTYLINIVWPPKILFTSYDSIREANFVGATEVQLNQELKLNCVVDGYPNAKIMWEKPDYKIVNGSLLHIEKMTIEEQGTYRCIALNDYGWDEKYYDLEIIKSRPKKTNDDMETRKFILEGNDLRLSCPMDAYPAVSYTWFYNGEIVSNGSQYLRKTSMKPEDRGWYTCLARNVVGSEQINFGIHVYNLPKITYINASTTINEFDEFNLECIAKGIPLPIISWQLNDEIVLTPSDDIYQKHESGQLSQFSIPMIHGGGNGIVTLYDNYEISLKIIYAKNTKKKAGKYVCNAINHSGYNEKFVEIKVHSNSLTKSENFSKIQYIDVIEGRRLTLQCPTQQSAILYFLWRKDKKNINDSNNHVLFAKAGQHLKIFRANFRDAGIYECVCVKENYAEKFFFNVTVLESVNERSKRIDISESAYVHLNCSSTGYPIPLISWFKGGESIEFLSNYDNYKLSDNNQTLAIFLNDFTSFGRYMCKAENYHDVIEKYFDVSYYEKLIWSDWSPCSKTCGEGKKYRQQECLKSDVHCIDELKIEVRDCEVVPCYDDYAASGDYLYREYDETEDFCGKGYEFKNNKCQDINECHGFRSNCDDYKQMCLNKNGSYTCLPTPCKPQHRVRKTEKRYPHEVTKDCMQFCFNSNCATKAIVAETIQYSVLSLSKIPKLNEPIKTFVNYNRKGRPLEHTDFRLIKKRSTKMFYLKNKLNSNAISKLCTREILQKEKLYVLELVAKSFQYQQNEVNILDNKPLYYTRYYVYIYIV